MRAFLLTFVTYLALGLPTYSANAEDPTKPPVVKKANAALKNLLQEAAAISEKEMAALRAARPSPKLSDIRNQSLSALALLLATMEPRFPFPIDVNHRADAFALELQPKPEVADPVGETLDQLSRVMRCEGEPTRYSLFRTDHIAGVAFQTKGNTASGTIEFRAEGHYSGKVNFEAESKDEKWIVTKFHLPAFRLATVRGDKGEWRVDHPELFVDELRQTVVTDIPWPEPAVGPPHLKLFVAADGTVRGADAPQKALDASALRALIDMAGQKVGGPEKLRIRVSAHDNAKISAVCQVVHACHSAKAPHVAIWIGRQIFAEPKKDEDSPRLLSMLYTRVGPAKAKKPFDVALDNMPSDVAAIHRMAGKLADSHLDPCVHIEHEPQLRMKELAKFYAALVKESNSGRPLIALEHIYLEPFRPFVLRKLEHQDEALKPLPIEQPTDEIPTEIDLTKNLVKGDGKPNELKFQDTEGLGGGLPIADLNSSTPASNISQGYACRGHGSRAEQVARRGGTKATERAVAAGLNWLARHQGQDGSWSFAGFTEQCKPGKCTDPGHVGSDAAGTALALLPFLAAGQSSHTAGPYRENVFKGVHWLLAHQDKSTGRFSSADGKDKDSALTQALCMMAVCEAYGLAKVNALEQSARIAITSMASLQTPSGGWRQDAQKEPDIFSTCWSMMALRSAQLAELKVPPTVLDRAGKYFEGSSKLEKDAAATAASLLGRQCVTPRKNDAGLIDGSTFLASRLPDAPTIDRKGDMYYWFFGTAATFNMQGEEWDNWNKKMRRALVNTQERQGCSAGSWAHMMSTDLPPGMHDGRLAMTSLACLILETYYRYPPIYDAAKTP